MPFLLRQGDRQAEALQCGRGEDEDRVGVAAVAVQPGLPEPGFGQRPVDQRRDGLGGHVQDQPADAVRRHLPVLAVDDRERPVLEARIGGRRGGLRRRLLRTRAPRRRRRPGGAARLLRRTGRRHSGGRGGRLRGRAGERLRDHGRRGGGGRFGGRDGEAGGEALEEPGVRGALRRPRLGPTGLPVPHGLTAGVQRRGDLRLAQARRLPQTLALRRVRQIVLRNLLQQRINGAEQLVLSGHRGHLQ